MPFRLTKLQFGKHPKSFELKHLIKFHKHTLFYKKGLIIYFQQNQSMLRLRAIGVEALSRKSIEFN